MLDDGVIGCPSIDKRDSIQRDTDADEVEDLVDERTGGCQKHEGINLRQTSYLF